jgi:ribosome-associated translation inhibitor RaiA
MQATQVTLHNLHGSPALLRRIRAKCERLERFHPHLLYCRVSVEQEEARTRRARPYLVTLRIGIPGREIVVSHTHHVDAHLAVRDAFAAARRQLRDASNVGRGEVKDHSRTETEMSHES